MGKVLKIATNFNFQKAKVKQITLNNTMPLLVLSKDFLFTNYKHETGNNVRKTHWKYTVNDPDPVFDVSGDSLSKANYD